MLLHSSTVEPASSSVNLLLASWHRLSQNQSCSVATQRDSGTARRQILYWWCRFLQKIIRSWQRRLTIAAHFLPMPALRNFFVSFSETESIADKRSIWNRTLGEKWKYLERYLTTFFWRRTRAWTSVPACSCWRCDLFACKIALSIKPNPQITINRRRNGFQRTAEMTFCNFFNNLLIFLGSFSTGTAVVFEDFPAAVFEWKSTLNVLENR